MPPACFLYVPTPRFLCITLAGVYGSIFGECCQLGDNGRGVSRLRARVLFRLRRPTFPSSWKSGQKSHSRGGGSPLLPLKIPSCDQGGGLRPPSLDSPPTGGTHPWGIPKGAAAPIGRLGWGSGGRGVRNPLPPAALLPTFAAVGKSRSPKANNRNAAFTGAAGWGHPAPYGGYRGGCVHRCRAAGTPPPT